MHRPAHIATFPRAVYESSFLTSKGMYETPQNRVW